VTGASLLDRIRERAAAADVALTGHQFERLEAYCRLLERWNRRMNLTALPLRDFPDATLDRLLLEPLAAARLLDNAAERWLDLGSGGGSPAIPIKVARPRLDLTMVESRSRKAAFLREAVRSLGLKSAGVAEARIEALGSDWEGEAELVTVRAVRMDQELFDVVQRLLRSGGRLLLFGPPPVGDARFRLRARSEVAGTRTGIWVLDRL
jgi:16S rRNA (guanine527-N7)-methyltransferase